MLYRLLLRSNAASVTYSQSPLTHTAYTVPVNSLSYAGWKRPSSALSKTGNFAIVGQDKFFDIFDLSSGGLNKVYSASAGGASGYGAAFLHQIIGDPSNSNNFTVYSGDTASLITLVSSTSNPSPVLAHQATYAKSSGVNTPSVVSTINVRGSTIQNTRNGASPLISGKYWRAYFQTSYNEGESSSLAYTPSRQSMLIASYNSGGTFPFGGSTFMTVPTRTVTVGGVAQVDYCNIQETCWIGNHLIVARSSSYNSATKAQFDVYDCSSGTTATRLAWGLDLGNIGVTTMVALPGNKLAIASHPINPANGSPGSVVNRLFCYQYNGNGTFTALTVDDPKSYTMPSGTNAGLVNQLVYGVGQSQNLLYFVGPDNSQGFYQVDAGGLTRKNNIPSLTSYGQPSYAEALSSGELFLVVSTQAYRVSIGA